MDYKIMSRDVCERYAKQKHNKTSVIISIKSSWDRVLPDLPQNDTNNILDVLSLSFDDIEVATCNKFSDNKRIGLITKEDSYKIVEFVTKWAYNVDTIICHCDGGISRSAGVMAAIQRYLIDDDSGVFRLQKKHPNMTCYLTVLKGFEEKANWSINSFVNEK